MTTYTFEVAGQPKPQARPRVTRNGTYTPQASRDWKEAVGRAAWLAKVQSVDGPVELHIVLGGALRGDVDNYAKGIMDALNGIAYKDDRQVKSLSVTLLKRKTPYCQIKITHLADDWEASYTTPKG